MAEKLQFLNQVNPHALVVQKAVDEVFSDVSKVKESSFFKSDFTDPLRFSMRIFWKIPI